MQPDNFGQIFQTQAKLGKYLKEEYCLEQYQQLTFEYFVKPFFILKLLSKVS